MRGAWVLLAALASPLASPLAAEITPEAGSGDPHIQSVAYDPQEVVALHVAAGYAVTVQFSPDERIETVTLGDSGGWRVEVDHRADHLVVKPQGFAAPTNLTVISDQRTYNFTLYGGTAGVGVQPYLVRFAYPAPPAPPVAAAAPGRYKLHGDRALWPEGISDDGAFTTIRWRADAAMPAVYREDTPGDLALVNGETRGGAYVVEGVHARLVFILGKARAQATRIRDRDGA